MATSAKRSAQRDSLRIERAFLRGQRTSAISSCNPCRAGQQDNLGAWQWRSWSEGKSLKQTGQLSCGSRGQLEYTGWTLKTVLFHVHESCPCNYAVDDDNVIPKALWWSSSLPHLMKMALTISKFLYCCYFLYYYFFYYFCCFLSLSLLLLQIKLLILLLFLYHYDCLYYYWY